VAGELQNAFMLPVCRETRGGEMMSASPRQLLCALSAAVIGLCAYACSDSDSASQTSSGGDSTTGDGADDTTADTAAAADTASGTVTDATSDSGGVGDTGGVVDTQGAVDSGPAADVAAPQDVGSPKVDAGCDKPDQDGDCVIDSKDNCPAKDNPGQEDLDKDGKGDVCDDDIDGDGLDNSEEGLYGTDCNVTDPNVADGDGDGIKDGQDVYPNDPFPPFLLVENAAGSIDVHLTNTATGGKFAKKVGTGNNLGKMCGVGDGGCGKQKCPSQEGCVLGKCVPYLKGCGPCQSGKFCRQILYRDFQIADWSGDGKMDFLTRTWPPDKDGNTQLWYFNRPLVNGVFSQHFIAKTDKRVGPVIADVDGDHAFDSVGYTVNKPNYLASVRIHVWLGNNTAHKANCVVGAGCVFTEKPGVVDLTNHVNKQWGFLVSRTAFDGDNDGNLDLIFGTYPNGGNSATTVRMLLGQGKGIFDTTKFTTLFVHNKKQGESPVNAMLFADFDADKKGDVLLGLDDDGDAGAMWFYKGTGAGKFAQTGQKVIDINPACNKGCSDKAGVTSAARTFDFDFDGKLDVIIGWAVTKPGTAPSRIVIHYGDGTGKFKKPATQIGKDYDNLAGTRFAIPTRMCPWYP
jgi:hypothetical protein